MSRDVARDFCSVPLVLPGFPESVPPGFPAPVLPGFPELVLPGCPAPVLPSFPVPVFPISSGISSQYFDMPSLTTHLRVDIKWSHSEKQQGTLASVWSRTKGRLAGDKDSLRTYAI